VASTPHLVFKKPLPPKGKTTTHGVLDRQGWLQALGGIVIALIALLSSYDHISFPAVATLQLPQQSGVWFTAASMQRLKHHEQRKMQHEQRMKQLENEIELNALRCC
jgi:hypothetical protein